VTIGEPGRENGGDIAASARALPAMSFGRAESTLAPTGFLEDLVSHLVTDAT
jgi:hypothetical protein